MNADHTRHAIIERIERLKRMAESSVNNPTVLRELKRLAHDWPIQEKARSHEGQVMTPHTPWHAITPDQPNEQVPIVNRDGVLCATGRNDGTGNGITNAAYVVKCVNAHEEWVKALQLVQTALQDHVLIFNASAKSALSLNERVNVRCMIEQALANLYLDP